MQVRLLARNGDAGDLAALDFELLIPIVDEDLILRLDPWGGPPEVFLDASDGVIHPLAAAAPFYFAIP